MSTLSRTWQNLRKIGLKEYGIQMHYIGDTKAGRFVGADKAGNKYFENIEELPLRHRWVEYAKHDVDAAQINPGWHAWMSYMVDTPPSEDKTMQAVPRWQRDPPLPNLTATKGNFITYNTVKPKIRSWEPKAVARQ